MTNNLDKQKVTTLKSYHAFDFSIESVDLHIELFEDKTIVRNEMIISRTSRASTNLMLHGEGLKLLSVQLNERDLTPQQYQLTDSALILFDVPDKFQCVIVTEIMPHLNTALSGLYRSGKLYCTQCEAEGFRRITYYPDRPDVLSRFTTTVVADKTEYPVLLANGNKREKGELAHNRHFVTWQDPFRKPCYLFALVAGDLHCIRDTFTTQSKREIALEIYVEAENKDKCDYAMGALKRSMTWDEETYAREYDLDVYMIVAVNDFNMGAMENKGLNIFNAKYILANEKTATDLDFQLVESVIGHEYFHNWTGNRVTCRDWFQLSLKEGLTVFREQQFSAQMGSAIVKRINDVRLIKTRQFAEDAGPMAHPVRPESYIEINNFYTTTVYNKGAEVIRMLHTLLGQTGFRKGMDLYFERHDGHAVTIEDFVSAMSDANQFNLDQFQLWYSQAGTPQVEVEAIYDDIAHTFTLTFKQHCPATPDQEKKLPFLIPIKFALYDEEGRALQTEHGNCLIIQDREHQIVFKHVKTKPVPSLLRDFSAPVKLEYPYQEADLILLMRHDEDQYNRWDASQRLCAGAIKSLMKEPSIAINSHLIEVYRQLLNDKNLNPALLAQMLMLPSFQYMAEQFNVINVDAILKARRAFIDYFCQALDVELKEVYGRCAKADDEKFSGKAQEIRLLRNIALAHLTRLNDLQNLQLAEQQYHQSANMTNIMGALVAVNHSSHPLREKLFSDFYQTWQHQILLVNKWLGLNAVCELPDALEKIEFLLKHKAFDIKNPNKVYALINAFGASNAERFHDSQGKGYDFIAQRIIDIDPLNPQVAARLLENLTPWRRLDEPHGQRMKQALLKIQAQKTVSEDIYEIVSKTLQ